MTGAINPLWEQIKQLPPEQQDQLLRQHAPGAANVQEAQQAPAQPMPTGQAKGLAPSLPQEMPQGAGPGTEPSQGTPAVAKAPSAGLAPNPDLDKAKAEFGRVTAPDTGQHNKQNTGTSGLNQVHNPWARIPLQILDAVGGGLFPGIEERIPGTEGHHNAV